MNDLLLFIGDSITDAGRLDDPDGLGRGWVRMVADALRADGDETPIVNTGIGGDRAIDLRRRWQADALAHAPSVLTIYVGINDTWRRYDAGDHTTDAAFEADYRELLDRTSAALLATRVILVEPFLTPVTEAQRSWHADLDGKRRVVRALAAETGATLVPLHDILTAAAARYGDEAIAADGVHPSPLGARLIAEAWLAAAR